jgi:NOL1/NOP2/fmu family ribosome biogenesis protein
MMPLRNPEKEKIIKKLNEQFGITNLPYLLLMFGAEKVRLYSGGLSKDELLALDRTLRIENLGLYFANKKDNEEIRLTLDAVQLLKPQITKNILEIDEKQAKEWLKGYDLNIITEKGFKIISYKKEFIGCGRSTGDRITNFVPKERRIKN